MGKKKKKSEDTPERLLRSLRKSINTKLSELETHDAIELVSFAQRLAKMNGLPFNARPYKRRIIESQKSQMAIIEYRVTGNMRLR